MRQIVREGQDMWKLRSEPARKDAGIDDAAGMANIYDIRFGRNSRFHSVATGSFCGLKNFQTSEGCVIDRRSLQESESFSKGPMLTIGHRR